MPSRHAWLARSACLPAGVKLVASLHAQVILGHGKPRVEGKQALPIVIRCQHGFSRLHDQRSYVGMSPIPGAASLCVLATPAPSLPLPRAQAWTCSARAESCAWISHNLNLSHKFMRSAGADLDMQRALYAATQLLLSRVLNTIAAASKATERVAERTAADASAEVTVAAQVAALLLQVSRGFSPEPPPSVTAAADAAAVPRAAWGLGPRGCLGFRTKGPSGKGAVQLALVVQGRAPALQAAACSAPVDVACWCLGRLFARPLSGQT